MSRIIDQWSSAAKLYAKGQEESEFAESNKRMVKSRFRDLNGSRLGDVGCGYGFYTDYFASIGAEAGCFSSQSI